MDIAETRRPQDGQFYLIHPKEDWIFAYQRIQHLW